MSQLLCYWEEADRCLNQGEMKISLVATQSSIHAGKPTPYL